MYIKFNLESVPGLHSSQNSFLPPPKICLNFAIWIKTQYLQSDFRQNVKTPDVQKIVRYFFFFS